MKTAVVALLLASGAARAQDFAPPAPGTYKLEHILSAPSGTVLDEQGKARPFSRFTTGKITVLSLVYTKCSDGTGCPLATHRMKELKERIDEHPELVADLRLVSLSFDPDRDTAEVMRAYRRAFFSGSGGAPWHFLTTRSRREIEPILRGFGQDVWMPRAGAGALSHVLKVFLIDPRGSVREIYSTSFLQTQVLLNDIQTLLLERGGEAQRAANHRATAGAARQPLPIAAYATTHADVLAAPPATSSAAPKITGPSIPPPNPARE
jgi:cytochrome oxidase Cu insertion factor (SCO1/SenC/PrrC family)